MALDGINSITGIAGNEIKVVEAGYDNSKMQNEDFLKVLLADLQWQDPLEAKDISEFIANTVKLREMEVLNEFQTTVELLKSVNETNSLLYASSLIGKTVMYQGDKTYVENGTGKSIFTLENNADTVNVTVVDKDGNIVDTKTFTNLQAGTEYPFEINNSNLQDGYYTIYINAYKGEDSVKATIYSYAKVEYVEKEQDKIYISFGDAKVELSKVSQIGG